MTATSRRRKRPVNRSARPWVHIAIGGILLLWLVPALGVLVASFRTAADTNRSGWWSALVNLGPFTVENYRHVVSQGFGQAFLNSLAITVPTTIVVVLVASYAAYALSWMSFRGKRIVFLLIVGLLIVPLQLTFIPVLDLLRHMKLSGFAMNGSFLAVWLAHSAYGISFAVYLLRNFMASLPKEIIESGRVDGASVPTIFFRLVLPLSLPGVAALSIFQFLGVWNDLLVALVYLGPSPTKHPLPVKLANLATNFGGDWQYLAAAAFVSMIVPLVFFFSLQKYFVRGVTGGAVKG